MTIEIAQSHNNYNYLFESPRNASFWALGCLENGDNQLLCLVNTGSLVDIAGGFFAVAETCCVSEVAAATFLSDWSNLDQDFGILVNPSISGDCPKGLTSVPP